MTKQLFEFKLCSNGYNYLYKNNELYITEKGDYVLLEQKGDVVELLNKLHEENQELRLQLNLCSDQRNEFHRGARENANRVGKLEKENEQLKKQIEYQEEGIVDAIDSLIELPSATIYLLKQWLDAFEEYDSIEDMKNTFSERIKELEE